MDRRRITEIQSLIVFRSAADIRRVAEETEEAKLLAPFRKKIDTIDDKIVDLLAKRFALVRQVGVLKARRGLELFQTARVEEVKERNAARAGGLGLSSDLVRAIYGLIIDEAHAEEHALGAKTKKSG